MKGDREAGKVYCLYCCSDRLFWQGNKVVCAACGQENGFSGGRPAVGS